MFVRGERVRVELSAQCRVVAKQLGCSGGHGVSNDGTVPHRILEDGQHDTEIALATNKEGADQGNRYGKFCV